MAGAIALSGQAALRSGAGLVTVATNASSANVVAGFEPSYMTVPLPESSGGNRQLVSNCLPQVFELAASSDSLAVGPGLGNGHQISRISTRLYREAATPAVFDADALNGLAASSKGLSAPGGPRIITPHLGEFRRLANNPDLDRAAAVEVAKQVAAENKIIVVLKGAGTLVTDGQRHVVNQTGNPGMATGGTGDVLTGIIGGLLAQGMPPFDAAVAATHLHGTAGDLAAAALGQISMIASDLLSYLPPAIQQYATT